MTKKIVIAVFILSNIMQSKAQDILVYNQYLTNPFLYNPAWAGSTTYDELRGSHREQWVGIQDAPTTQTLSFQKKFRNVGLGANLYNDQNGRTGYQGFELAYAYHLQLSNYKAVKKQNMLVFGLSLSMHHYKVDVNDLMSENYDPALDGDKTSAWVPAMNFGLLYRNGHYNLGLSVTQLLSKSIKFGDIEAESVKPGTVYLFNSYDLQVSSLLEVSPSILIKYNQNNEKQFDAGLKTTYRGNFGTNIWFGIFYRGMLDSVSVMGNAIIANAGIVFNRYYFGYTYEMSLSDLKTYNSGTHEITVGYNFGGRQQRNLKNPAYRPGEN
ncbi:MAG: type IX secretion system membrane protein PorP/SprF [Bacteroidales bacterium]